MHDSPEAHQGTTTRQLFACAIVAAAISLSAAAAPAQLFLCETAVYAVTEDTEFKDSQLCKFTLIIVAEDAKVTLPSAGSVVGRRVLISVWSDATVWSLPPGCGFVSEAQLGFNGLSQGKGNYYFIAVPAYSTQPGRWTQLGGLPLVLDPAAPACGGGPSERRD